MISIGNNIKNNTDELKKCTLKYLYEAIRKPRPDIASRINQLRIVFQINPSQYTELKRQLPYFVCGIFNPSLRKNENFAYTEYFIVDIDHISDKGLILSDLRQKIAADSRVLMCFTSPSGNGLKIMFQLANRCYDASIYRIFYKLFIEEFSQQYNLQQVIDGKTCDVSRACFISEDPDIYFNPESDGIEISKYIDCENNINEAIKLKHEVEEQLKDAAKKQEKKDTTNIDQETIDKIKKTLNPAHKLKQEKTPAYIPEALEDIMGDLEKYISDKGINMTEVVNIQYGKKIHFKIGVRQAEINLFFGKRGFSVIQTPRSGTDKEMNQLMADVIEAFIAEYI